jgi:hypothetical protein
MTLLVDPPQRDSAAQRNSSEGPATTAVTLKSEPAAEPENPAVQRGGSSVGVATSPTTEAPPNLGVPPAPSAQAEQTAQAQQTAQAGPAAPEAPKLAEPPITGGRVEDAMGVLIRVLSHSPLARPLPAVLLSALGLGGVAFVGLCATAPTASVATPPVLLPLTSIARDLGAPHLPDWVADTIMYAAISLCCLGLAMMLWANSRGWSPRPRRVFAAAVAAVAVVVNITPVGSSDIASYAAYGRMAALGINPYTNGPSALSDLHLHVISPYTTLVSKQWQTTASVYGPVSTWMHLLAATIGGAKPWLTIWVLMVMIGAAFVVTGYVLLRTAANPVRAVLLWVANPLLIAELVMGGHMDAVVALFAIAAIVLSRRCTRLWHDMAAGLLVGVAGGIKVNAVFVALGIAIPLIHDRDWGRLLRIGAIAGVTTFGLYYFSYGFVALKPLGGASTMVISPTIWRGVQEIALLTAGSGAETMVTHVIAFAWLPLLLLLAWYLYNRLSPDVPTVVAATCALTFAWIVVAPWSLPWYASIAWVTLALLPRNSLTRWLTLATGALALLHFNGGHTTNPTIAPTP